MTTAAILAASGSPGTTTGFKNRIINGAMVIDQRNAGASVTPGSGKLYVVDRWAVQSAAASKFTVGQNLNSVTPPAGFANYFGISVASAYTPSSTDYNYLVQSIEGNNTSDLNWGSSTAKTVALSFWAYASVAGTYPGFICGRDFNNAYPFTFALPASTWTYITLTIPGPTTGAGTTWFSGTNTSINVGFSLGMGSNWSGATPFAWNGASLQATGSVSLVTNAGATFYVTGVQLEVGTTATNFDYRSIGTELALCQRYYQTCGLTSNAMSFSGNTRSVNNAFFNVPLCCAMRATPSYSITNGGTTRVTFAGTEVNSSANSTTLGGVSPIVVYDASGNFNLNLNYQGAISGITLTGSTAGMAIMWSPAGNFNFSAEL